jgi:hypothetical protein
MSEYTPFSQSFSGQLEIEEYKRHLTMPDDPCSTCYYYPDNYSDCWVCGGTAHTMIELTGFSFPDVAFSGPKRDRSGIFSGKQWMPSYPFTYTRTVDGVIKRLPSTIVECQVSNPYVGNYQATMPWPVGASSSYYLNPQVCAGQIVTEGLSAKSSWGDRLGLSCAGNTAPCYGCPRLPTTYIENPSAYYTVEAHSAYNLTYATSYAPGCQRQAGTNPFADACEGNDWTEIFTLPPGLVVYIYAYSNRNSCFDDYIYPDRHFCFQVWHMDLNTGVEQTRDLGYWYEQSGVTAYKLKCQQSGNLNLIYSSDNDYYYSNGFRYGCCNYSNRPQCVGEFHRPNGWGRWNGGDGQVVLNTQTAVVIPVSPKAGTSASASGTASVG